MKALRGPTIPRLAATLTLILALALTAGCGFRPLYGRGPGGHPSPVAAHMSAIAVTPMPNRIGQMMWNMLVDELTPRGVPDRPRYRLQVQLSESVARAAIDARNDATRNNLTIVANFELTDLSNGDSLLRSHTQAISSYNVSDTSQGAYQRIVSQENARRLALAQISDILSRRIALRLSAPPS